MLASKDQVLSAMSLTAQDLSKAARRNGYNDAEYASATFLGFNGTSFVYEVGFYDLATSDFLQIGRVYVSLKRKPLDNEFRFYLEY